MKFWDILYLRLAFLIKHAQYAQSGTVYVVPYETIYYNF